MHQHSLCCKSDLFPFALTKNVGVMLVDGQTYELLIQHLESSVEDTEEVMDSMVDTSKIL